MLIIDCKILPDGITVSVNLELVCFINPVDLNRAKKDKPGYKPQICEETCGLAMANGIVLHVEKPAKSIRAAMAGYSGGRR